MDADHSEACKPTDLTGAKTIEMLTQNSLYTTWCNTLMSLPTNSEYKLAVVQFSVPGAKRVDPIPIANGAGFVIIPQFCWIFRVNSFLGALSK